MSRFDGHFDNLAAAATNSGMALYQLTTTTTTQHPEIKSLLNALKTTSSPGSYSAAVATPLIPTTEAKCRISQL